MKKRFCLPCILALSLGALPALAGCEASGSGESFSRQYTYTVRFFDDAATPQQVGYAYIAQGGAVGIIRPMNEGEPYDWKTHSTTPIPFGKRSVFSTWEGTYADSTPVDLSSIQGDCDLYAHYANETLSYKAVFKDGSTKLDSSSAAIEWGTFPTLPATDPTRSVWGYDTPFEGYGFESTSASGWKGENTAAFLHGAGDPTSASIYDESNALVTSPTIGSLYEDTSNFDFYGYSGAWKKIGNFEETTIPTVTYQALFGETLADFEVKFYDDDPNNGGTLLATESFSYSTAVTFSSDKKSVSGENANGPVALDFSPDIAPNINYWQGYYSSDPSVPERFRGQVVDRTDPKVAAPCFFYPVFF